MSSPPISSTAEWLSFLSTPRATWPRTEKPWDPAAFPLADAVRISAGYPFMFPPVKLRDAATGTLGALVDGGIVSSFPVFLFDRRDPCHPTWGFRLHEHPRPPAAAIAGAGWPLTMVRAILETSINELDDLSARAFSHRTITIPTGGVAALQFELHITQKQALWRAGHAAAEGFFAAAPTARNIYGHEPPAASLPDGRGAGCGLRAAGPATINRVRNEKERKHSADRRAERKGIEYV